MDKLSPGGHRVNQFVHEMQKFRVNQQILTHSTLRAVTFSWHVIPLTAAAVQRTIPAALARSDGRLTPSGDKPAAGVMLKLVGTEVA